MGWDGMGWDGMGWNGMGWDGMRYGMEWDGMEWDGMEWDGMGWNGMGWNGMEWDGRGSGRRSLQPVSRAHEVTRLMGRARLVSEVSEVRRDDRRVSLGDRPARLGTAWYRA